MITPKMFWTGILLLAKLMHAIYFANRFSGYPQYRENIDVSLKEIKDTADIYINPTISVDEKEPLGGY